MKLIVLRGLPGAGKSTFVQDHFPGATPFKYAPMGWDTIVCSADNFFTSLTGDYNYDPTKIGEAHATAITDAIKAMEQKVPVVIYDNTCTRRYEWAVVAEVARVLGYIVEIIDLYDGGKTDEELAARNLHGVSVEKIAAMRARWERKT